MAQLLLGILVVIIIIIIVFVIVIIVIVIIVIIIIFIIIIIIIIFIIIVIIIQVGRLFSANCVVNVVQEYRIAKPARSHTSHFIFFLFFTVNQDNNFTDSSRSTWAPSVTRVTTKVTRVQSWPWTRVHSPNLGISSAESFCCVCRRHFLSWRKTQSFVSCEPHILLIRSSRQVSANQMEICLSRTRWSLSSHVRLSFGAKGGEMNLRNWCCIYWTNAVTSLIF